MKKKGVNSNGQRKNDRQKDQYVGKVWREGKKVFCEYLGCSLTLGEYDSVEIAMRKRNELLFKLGRLSEWI